MVCTVGMPMQSVRRARTSTRRRTEHLLAKNRRASQTKKRLDASFLTPEFCLCDAHDGANWRFRICILFELDCSTQQEQSTMPAPAATGLSGLYTVEFHKPPDEGPAPQPSWDASRSSGGIQPSKEKMRRVLKEEAKRDFHRESRLLAYTRASSDSPRPAGGDLPYFDYDWKAPDEPAYMFDDVAMGRIDHNWPFLEHKAARKARCSNTAWHSGEGKPYNALGGVPMVPAAVTRPPLPKTLQIRGDVGATGRAEPRGGGRIGFGRQTGEHGAAGRVALLLHREHPLWQPAGH